MSAARERFAAAVSMGVSELTRGHGYSRERAVLLLLGEIRRDDTPPTDNEIFRAMEYLGMGMEEASKTVTVARALRRARLERSLSAVDAIDDLTSKLSLSNIVGKVDSPISVLERVGAEPNVALLTNGAPVPAKSASKQTEGSASPAQTLRMTLTTPKKSYSSRTSQKGMRPKSSSRISTVKGSNRKRPLAVCDENVVTPPVASITKKNAVKVELNDKAKGQIVEEKVISNEQSLRNKVPTPSKVRSKRAASLRGEEAQILTQQPILKRARVESEL